MEMSGNINNLDGDAAVRYAQEVERIRAARARRRWITAAIIVGSLFLLMVGCGAAVGIAASGGSTAHASAAAPTAATSAPATPGLHEETRIVPAPAQSHSAPEGPRPAPVTPAPSVELPYTWISPGMWLVGPEIEPGTYRSLGPDASGSCYIDAQVGDHYAAQETSDDGPVRVTVAEGQTVEMSGCLPFAKVG
jgi:hypothetical protein